MAKRPKRRQDHAKDFDDARDDFLASFVPDPLETYDQARARAKQLTDRYESATSRMDAALKATDDGLKRAIGIAPKESKVGAVCDRIARRYPLEVRAFARGEAITDKRLAEMIGSDKVKVGSVRRALGRRYREGTARRPPPTPVAGRSLDIRHGEIYRPSASAIDKGIDDAIPSLRRFRR